MKIDTSYKLFRLKDFSGGWASVPQKEQEAEIFTNLEVTRENYARTTFGSIHFNSTDIADNNNYLVHSIGSGSTSLEDSAFIAGTTENKIWIGFGKEYPITMTDITDSAVLSGGYWAFQQFVDSGGSRILMFCNATDGLWLTTGGPIQEVLGAPSTPIVMASYQGHLMIVKQPNQLWFSDHLNYSLWPGANFLEFTMERGMITGLASLPGKLLIFFQKGMGVITARKASQFASSFQLTGSTGTHYPLTISAYGSEIALLTTSGPVIIDPTGTVVEYIGESTKEFWLELDDDGLDQFTWRGVLTPFYYALIKFPDPTIYLYDRRSKTWSKKTVPNGLNPTSLACLDYAYEEPPVTDSYSRNTSGILFGSQDGYIHLLQLAGLSGSNLNGGNAEWDTTVTINKPVLATWKSKEFDLGSFNMLKTLRRAIFQLSGENISFTIHFRTKNGSIDSETYSYPGSFDTSNPFNVSLGNKLCRAFSLEISGNNLEIRQVTIIYKDKRLAFKAS